MAHLHANILELRFQSTCDYIIQVWEDKESQKDTYAIQCLCQIDCFCMSEFEVPRIVLDRCLWVCELDRLFVEQPFCHPQGFDILWHCDVCTNEMCCGFPPLGIPQLIVGVNNYGGW